MRTFSYGGGMLKLQQLMDNYTKKESIESYACTKCKLRNYLQKFIGNKQTLKNLGSDEREDILMTYETIDWINVPLQC